MWIHRAHGGPRRPPSAPASPLGLLRTFLLALVLHSTITCRILAAPLALLASNTPALPELDRSVEVLTCSPQGCGAEPKGSVPKVCTTRNTVLVYDGGACFMAATEHAGFRPFDLSKCSGGEVVFCKQLFHLLKSTGYTYAAINSVTALEACVLAGREVNVEHVLFVHGSWWQKVASATEKFMNGHRIRPPFREDCLMTMTLWPTEHPYILWPGDLKYYVSSFPVPPMHNSYILMGKPSQCPTSRTFKQPRLPPYGVLFEKFKVMPWKVNHTNPFSHNATFWREMQRRVHLVVLDCNDALAAKLQWDTDYKTHMTCWKDSPLSKEFSYHDLMMGARFFLGLGATPQSPTPVDLNYCKTPIIMPANQQPFIAAHARPGSEYFNAQTSDGVLRAVDYIMANCTVAFQQGDGTVTKTNACFTDPPSLDAEMDDAVLQERFRMLMHSRELNCHWSPEKEQGKAKQ